MNECYGEISNLCTNIFCIFFLCRYFRVTLHSNSLYIPELIIILLCFIFGGKRIVTILADMLANSNEVGPFEKKRHVGLDFIYKKK